MMTAFLSRADGISQTYRLGQLNLPLWEPGKKISQG